MPFRLSILDLTAAVVVLVVLLLPPRSSSVSLAYEATDDAMREIALHQARLAANPGDAEAAEKLARLLTAAGQTDWAVQVASEAAGHAGDSAWRALLAASSAHAERIEVIDAHRFAREALEACRKAGPAVCPRHQEARLSIYFDQLEAGVKSGIDPRTDPRGYQQAVLSMMRMVRFRGATPDVESPAPEGKPNGSGAGPQSVEKSGEGPGEPPP